MDLIFNVMTRQMWAFHDYDSELSQWNNKQQLGGSYEDEVFVVHFRGQRNFPANGLSTTAWDSF